MSGKPDYYRKTEAMLYEYYTLEIAIPILERKNDSDKLVAKRQLKEDIDGAISRLSKSEQDFVQHVYGDPEVDVPTLCNLFLCSSATFYRDKRNIVKRIALFLGLV